MDKKKIVFIAIAVLILVVTVVTIFVLRETGNKETIESGNDKVSEKFTFKYNDVDVTPGTEFKDEAIKKEASVSEIPSCAFDGVDKVYNYGDVEITVSSVDGKDTVYQILFLDETVETSEGVKKADDKSVMLEKYGDDYEVKVGNQYVYTKGNVQLAFILENDVITDISYTLLTSV